MIVTIKCFDDGLQGLPRFIQMQLPAAKSMECAILPPKIVRLVIAAKAQPSSNARRFKANEIHSITPQLRVSLHC